MDKYINIYNHMHDSFVNVSVSVAGTRGCNEIQVSFKIISNNWCDLKLTFCFLFFSLQCDERYLLIC